MNAVAGFKSKTQNGFQASKNLTVGYGVHVANSCRQTENSQDAAVWNAVCLSLPLLKNSEAAGKSLRRQISGHRTIAGYKYPSLITINCNEVFQISNHPYHRPVLNAHSSN